MVRRIYDKANVGILLVGMPRLITNLKGEKRQYAQLFSRVGMYAKLEVLNDDDKQAIISSLLPNYKHIYPILSAFCAGNTRVLTKLLVRAIRIAELNEVEVDEEVLRKNITVSSVKDTELIEITVKNENPIYSAQIANEIAKVFTEKVKEIYNIDNNEERISEI